MSYCKYEDWIKFPNKTKEYVEDLFSKLRELKEIECYEVETDDDGTVKARYIVDEFS